MNNKRVRFSEPYIEKKHSSLPTRRKNYNARIENPNEVLELIRIVSLGRKNNAENAKKNADLLHQEIKNEYYLENNNTKSIGNNNKSIGNNNKSIENNNNANIIPKSILAIIAIIFTLLSILWCYSKMNYKIHTHIYDSLSVPLQHKLQ